MSLQDIRKKYAQFINPEFPQHHFSFSLLSMNRLSGPHGVLGGRFIQLLGDKSTGKTTLALDLVRSAQSQGMLAAYIDFEHTLDLAYAEYLGVNTEDLLVVKPDTAETGMDIAIELVESGEVKLVVIDSIATIMTREDTDKTMQDQPRTGSNALKITHFIRRMIPILDTHGALLVIINQYRANLAPMSRSKYKPYGPEIIQYQSSLTFELTRTKNGEDEAIVQAFVEKAKMGGKERASADIVMIYQHGFDIAGDIIRLALEEGIVEKKGSWFQYGEQRAQGMNQAREAFPIDEIKERLLSINTGATERL